MASARDKIRAVLAAEQRQGYLDSSVLGGFGQWLAEQGEPGSELERLGEAYTGAALNARPALWQQARAILLGQAGADGDGYAMPEYDQSEYDRLKANKQNKPKNDEPENNKPENNKPKNDGAKCNKPEKNKVAAPRPLSEKTDLLQTSIEYVKGVGPKRAALLRRLELYKVADLLYNRPRGYERRPLPVTLSQLREGELNVVCAQVLSRTVLRPRPGLAILKAMLGDGTGQAEAVWYNQQHLEPQLTFGRSVVVYGKAERRFGQVQITVQDYEFGETAGAGEPLPVYALTANLNQKSMRRLVAAAWDKYSQYVTESLPPELLERRQLLPLRQALYRLHFPKSLEEAEQARERLAYEELLITQLTVLSSRLPRDGGAAESQPRDLRPDSLEQFAAALPYPLTGAQRRVIGEIYRDMERPEPMRRLVQGDVGSGKTAVAAAALYKNWRAGLQGALMAPTELLAEQHLRSLEPLLGEKLGLRLGLLTGDTKGAERRRILAALAAGELDVLIGTHALFSADVEFARLGLAVTDEQHRFGVNQRSALRQKGSQADVLVLTATPIPRTLAMTFCGDLEASVIDELPPGRQPVRTYAVANNLERQALDFVLKELVKGRQAYIVCPLVEENEELELKSAQAYAERLQKQEFSSCSVALLHGKMKAQEKNAIMRAFAAGEIQALVSTTVIEVGVDVPNATVMLVRDAERFGLAQLHQLRGRVGRGGGQSYCLLLNNAKTREARERLKTLVESCDGFVIAEADLKLRGAGELLGTRQSGLAALRFADMAKDLRLVEQSREDAYALLQSGEYLRWPMAKEVRRKAKLLES